jgi:hypothetical protein
MAKKKRRFLSGRRNAAARVSLGNVAMKQTMAALAGGAGGALIGGLAVRAGIRPETAALGLMVGGGVAALTASGLTRYAAGGVAAAGAGQVALAWLAKRPTEQQKLASSADADKPRQGLGDGSDAVLEAFNAARNELDDEDVIIEAA